MNTQEKERLQAALDFANRKAVQDDIQHRKELRLELQRQRAWAILNGCTATWED